MKNDGLIEFSPAILVHLAIVGYKGLRVENGQKFSLIEPVTNVDAIEEMNNNNAYIIPIGNVEAYRIATRVLSLDMKFYINVNFIR